jgi:hypothetical protein
MMGLWRLVSGGSVRVLELAAMIEGEHGPELFLKHFNGRMEPRASEKDQTSGMRLIGSGDREMTFEGDEESGKVRLVYRRSGDDLVVVLEKGGKKQEFRFHRQSEKQASSKR